MDVDALIRQVTEDVLRSMGGAQQGAAQMPPAMVGGGAIPAQKFDYTKMDPSMTVEDVKTACELAKNKGYRSVCVPQWLVGAASEKLRGSGTLLTTVVGLPGGATSTQAKYAEVKLALKAGAGGVIIPLNIDMLKAGQLNEARIDVANAMIPASDPATVVKVLVEMDGISADGLAQAAKVAAECGADEVVLSYVSCGCRAEAGAVATAAASLPVSVLGGVSQDVAPSLISAGAAGVGASYTV